MCVCFRLHVCDCSLACSDTQVCVCVCMYVLDSFKRRQSAQQPCAAWITDTHTLLADGAIMQLGCRSQGQASRRHRHCRWTMRQDVVKVAVVAGSSGVSARRAATCRIRLLHLVLSLICLRQGTCEVCLCVCLLYVYIHGSCLPVSCTHECCVRMCDDVCLFV
jgi:hypothetical protein